MGDIAMKEIKTIKRYQNRKLYDTGASAYVTFDEITKMLKSGDDLRIIDNKTKNDITATTLIQLLYGHERQAKAPSSVGLLREIICQGEGSFAGYIQAMVPAKNSEFDQALPNQLYQSQEPGL